MHLRPFEIVLVGIFAAFALGGLIFLSLIKGGDDAEAMIYGEKVTVWGTFDQSTVNVVINNITQTDKAFSVVKYKQIDERSFESELLNAIAEGKSPDLVLIPHTLLVTYRSKLTPIPNESLDIRTLRDTYVEGTEIFTRADGTYAVPFAVDPLVLYWNRDLLSGAGLPKPPKTWEALVNETTPALTQLNSSREVVQSAIGMGEYQNVSHAKEILSMLLFQAGTNIVEEDVDRYIITLSRSEDKKIPPAQAALNFYTRFTSPNSDAYTWSRLRPLDRNAFTGGTLAMYLGFGSELANLQDENPNLNFDVAPVPQSQGATAQRNYGTFYGFAIPRATKNASGAFRAALVLARPDIADTLTSELGLTPVHRSLYAGAAEDPYRDVFEQAALVARGWLDPSPEETSDIFRSMIEDVSSGRAYAEEVIIDASYNLETLFR